MPSSRDNHYVPQWYQRGFLRNSKRLHYLDLTPEVIQLPDGRQFMKNSRSVRPTSQCFYQTDLYTTFFGEHINDEIERLLFGRIDDVGSRAVRAFIDSDPGGWHRNFSDFFLYIDSQKTRTPKGLDWIRAHYTNLNQLELMREMQAIQALHCTIWSEGVREIVSAKASDTKFILTDHPVTVYNRDLPPGHEQCDYPNDPSIVLIGTQTIFPLDVEHCLILTNLEYAQSPESVDLKQKRTNPSFVRPSMTRTDAFIRIRELGSQDVEKINLILKKRARRFVAAAEEDWLNPEQRSSLGWEELGDVLLPPTDELHHFGGEMYVGYEDGTTYYQDAFGRTNPQNTHLEKRVPEKLGRNDLCGCGSGKKYGNCCEHKRIDSRPAWNVLGIRERNLALARGVTNILGLEQGKSWEEVRRELSDDQVRQIHELYGILWPVETDIFDLLPKPDGTLRALYSGLVDPRTVPMNALGLIPYFDELLIQHTFVNPAAVKPEFSPIESPTQYKQQTLKNVFLLFMLMPFIEEGVVNFFPDPCFFDQHLHHQMLSMAEERKADLELEGDEADLLMKLGKEDFSRTLRMMPESYHRGEIAKAMPHLSEDEVEGVLQYMAEQAESDPYTVLQPIESGKDGGQLMSLSMAPNFELGFVIAQSTGSLLLTDSQYRWTEIQGAQYQQQGDTSYPWSRLTDLVGALGFPITANPEKSLGHRLVGDVEGVRKVLKSIYTLVTANESDLEPKKIDSIEARLSGGQEQAMRRNRGDEDGLGVESRFTCLAPAGGFVHQNVERLLLTSGDRKHLDRVPMAIFVKPTQRLTG